ncbi:MAG: hypothetical protein MUC83_17895 [Pirellula sp.]|nr:hypothetical protein [Pirellula sp.]
MKKPPRQKGNRSKGEYPDEKSLHESLEHPHWQNDRIQPARAADSTQV